MISSRKVVRTEVMYKYLNLLLLLELCSQYKVVSQSCVYKKGSDGLYYKFHNENVNWATAKATCDGESARLAIFSSPATYEHVKNTYSFHMSGIWIGARDMNSRNDWRWLDQRPVEKKYWQIGEPNNYQGRQEDCGMINYIHGPGRLHDAPCDWTGPKFLCQKEHRECVKEEGYCVADGRDVNTTRLNGVAADECLEKCLAIPNATGCSVIEEQRVEEEEEYGCYVATQKVTRGNDDERHACWIISKCVGTGSLAPHSPEVEPTSCKPYHCYKNAAQIGYDISYKKANTLDACSQHCCRMSQCLCIGFDWKRESHECWLSKTPRSRVPISTAEGVYSCEFKDIPAGYKKGYLGSFFKLYPDGVNWHTAESQCRKDGAQLAIDDSNAKHDYLVKTYDRETYWLGISDLELKGVWKYEDERRDEDERRVRTTFWDGGQPDGNGGDETCVVMWHTGRWHDDLCSQSRSFVCEVPGKMVNDHQKVHDNNNAFIPLLVIGLGCVLVFIAIRAFIHHKNRRRAVSPPSPTNEEAQVISNETVSQNVNGTVNESVPKPTDSYGIAVIPAPPQYYELYPRNNSLSGELPPPPSYSTAVIPATAVIPYNYNMYSGNSSSVP